MVEPLNMYGMNQTQWNQYQNDLANDPMTMQNKPSPNMWMYNKGYSSTLPSSQQYNAAVYGSFAPNQTQTAQAQQQADFQASKKTGIDPQKTSGYKFAQPLNGENSKMYLDAKAKDPNLTEYQWRQSHLGTDNGGTKLDNAVVPGSYSTPAVVGNRGVGNKAANVNTPTKQGSGDAKLANQAKVVTDKSGTHPANPTPGTTAKQSTAANQVKTSPTTTADKNSTAGRKRPLHRDKTRQNQRPERLTNKIRRLNQEGSLRLK